MWGTRKKAGAPGLLGMSNDEMKTILREAGQAQSGDRATLARRIIDLHLPLPDGTLAGTSAGTSAEVPTSSEEPTALYPLPLPCPNGTQVVNLKVEFLRPTYQNSKEWCEDPSGNNVYIGRGGPVFVDKVRYPPQSKWQNPFTVKKHGPNVIQLYDAYIRAQPFLEEIEELRGKQLGCWCVKPNDPTVRCHGHVLITILNERAGIQTPPEPVAASSQPPPIAQSVKVSRSSQRSQPAPAVPGIPMLRGKPLVLPPVPRIEPLPAIAGVLSGPAFPPGTSYPVPMVPVLPSPGSASEIVAE